jgi:putative acetyltransferase
LNGSLLAHSHYLKNLKRYKGMGYAIVSADNPGRLNDIRFLFREYEKYIGINLEFQSFENELIELPGKYSAPTGRLFLAMSAGAPVGCIALRALQPAICEMKRLYVRPEHRGNGLGRVLALKLIEEALDIGYEKMRLDTLDTLKEALRMYQSLGFHEIEAYYSNPHQGAIFMELALERQSLA